MGRRGVRDVVVGVGYRDEVQVLMSEAPLLR